ncbi:hypothetical protein TKK_0005292 [Trichogramma kaykai]
MKTNKRYLNNSNAIRDVQAPKDIAPPSNWCKSLSDAETRLQTLPGRCRAVEGKTVSTSIQRPANHNRRMLTATHLGDWPSFGSRLNSPDGVVQKKVQSNSACTGHRAYTA